MYAQQPHCSIHPQLGSIAVCLSTHYAATTAANSLNAHVPISNIVACCITTMGLMLFFMPHVRTLCMCIVGVMVAHLQASSQEKVAKAHKMVVHACRSV